jgi:hypothetical protein
MIPLYKERDRLLIGHPKKAGRPFTAHTRSFLPHPPFLAAATMGVQREPGQKGVNWSNIAVGERLALQRMLSIAAEQSASMQAVS